MSGLQFIMRKIFVSFAITLVLTVCSLAQIPFHGKYEEDFDSLLKKGKQKIANTAEVGVQAELPMLSGWQVAKIGGKSENEVPLEPSEGEAGTGRLFSFGHQSDTNRSLGALSTEALSTAFGVALINKTGKTIDRIEARFTAEVWRGASRKQDVFTCWYGLSTNSIKLSDFLTSSAMQPMASLNVEGPDVGRSNVAFDGKAESNRREIKASIENLRWAPDAILFLSWHVEDSRGHGAGLAMDDFSLTAP